MHTENENNKEENKAEEPAAAYETSNTKTITFFNSFEEMNESQYEHWRKLSPVQRLQEHYKLLTTTYTAEELNSNTKRINFKH